ncbi:MAG: glycosyltransferase family 4 protein [Terriglobales bacterium]
MAPRPRPALLYDGRWDGDHGLGRFAREVTRALRDATALTGGPPCLHPLEPLWLRAQLRCHRPRLYFTPGFNPPWGGATPLVFNIADLIHLHCADETGRRKRAYYRHIVLPAARRALFVLTPSEFSRQEIVDWSGISPEKVVVTGLGTGPEFHPKGPKHSPGYPYILSLGNARPHKNRARLVAAYAAAGLAHRGIHLVFNGAPEADLLTLARRLGVAAQIRFVGRIPESDLGAYYRGALGVAVPSTHEGFGLVALEAMACGAPVLTSNTTAVPEVVGEAALAVDPREVEAIGAGLVELVDNGGLRLELRERGLRRATSWTWAACTHRVQAALDAALAAANGR